MKNENSNHGLFGKLEIGEMNYFEDYKDIAKLVYRNTKKGIIMYRGIISFQEEVAKELMLKDQKAWSRYIENHIMTIAEKNNIKRENLCYVCAVHDEKSHPHIHIAFWDKSSKVQKTFVQPKTVHEIRRTLIKETFKNKILEFAKLKDETVKSIREVTNNIVEEFDKEMRNLRKSNYNKIVKSKGKRLEINDKFLNDVAKNIFKIRTKIPKKGRISYKLLNSEAKEVLDKLVEYVLEKQEEIKNLKEEYIKHKMSLINLYVGKEEYLKKHKEKYEKEINKIIANRTLGMIKTLNKLDREYKYIERYYVKQIIYEIIDLLIIQNRYNKNDINSKINKELSKEAKKDLYLEMQDKGYEHL